MNNQEDKKDKAEENFINNLFEKKEKDQNEQLYKNEFYILEEELKSKKNQNSLQFMHDVLLNKLMLEDYVPFPPNNEEPAIINNQKEEKKKEDDQDKLIEEENEFLRSLHKINYLTFSPFGLSFFEDNNKDKSDINEELLKEKEEKILHMIDFKYDNFEVTNDLLLNICQGFVDINKLKEENLTKNKEKEKEKEKTKPNEINNNDNKDDTIKRKAEEQNKIEEALNKIEQEFIAEIESKIKIPFYKNFLYPCFSEYKIAINRDERKRVIDKWKPLISKKDDEYRKYMKELKEKEKKELEEKNKIKEMERKKQKEKEEEEKNNEQLLEAYQDIIKNKRKNQKQNKTLNKSKSLNKQIKSTNKYYNKLTPKKNNNKLATKDNHDSNKVFSIYNSSVKNSNKNLSQSQPKIKPKNTFK